MITIKKDHLKSGHRVRPGKKLNLKYITIHSTGNPSSTASSERKWLDNTTNNRDASWNLCIDEKECIEAIPLDEVSWHAGSGNNYSIGIEICESGNRAVTLDRAAQLTAGLLRKYNMNISHLKRHYDWTNKSCPAIMMSNNWKVWNEFKDTVKSYMDKKVEVTYQTVNVGIITADVLNIRKTPEVKNDNVIGTYKQNEKVIIIGESNGFYKTDKGYISSNYVNASYDPSLDKTVPKEEPNKVVTDTLQKDEMYVLLNDKKVKIKGFIQEGTTYIGLRSLCEMIGYEVGYDPVNKIPTLKQK